MSMFAVVEDPRKQHPQNSPVPQCNAKIPITEYEIFKMYMATNFGVEDKDGTRMRLSCLKYDSDDDKEVVIQKIKTIGVIFFLLKEMRLQEAKKKQQKQSSGRFGRTSPVLRWPGVPNDKLKNKITNKISEFQNELKSMLPKSKSKREDSSFLRKFATKKGAAEKITTINLFKELPGSEGGRKNKTRKKRKLSLSDYRKILKFYKLPIPKNASNIRKKGDKIIAKKFCSCIKKVRAKFKKEGIAIGICTKSVINRKGYKRGKFKCKKRRSIKLYKGGSKYTKKKRRTHKKRGGVKTTKPQKSSNLKPQKPTQAQRKRWKTLSKSMGRKTPSPTDMIRAAALRKTTPSPEERKKATANLLAQLNLNKKLGGGKRCRRARKKRGGDGDLKEKLETIKVNKNMVIEQFKKMKKEKSIQITESQFIKFMNSVSDDDFNKIKEKLINEIIIQSSISNTSRNKQGGDPLQDLISVCFVLAVVIHFMLVGVKYMISRGLHASLENPGMEFQNDPQFDDPSVLQISAANFIMCIQAHRFPDQRRGGKRKKKTRKKRGGNGSDSEDSVDSVDTAATEEDGSADRTLLEEILEEARRRNDAAIYQRSAVPGSPVPSEEQMFWGNIESSTDLMTDRALKIPTERRRLLKRREILKDVEDRQNKPDGCLKKCKTLLCRALCTRKKKEGGRKKRTRKKRGGVD